MAGMFVDPKNLSESGWPLYVGLSELAFGVFL
jgi:hypothetical protein